MPVEVLTYNVKLIPAYAKVAVAPMVLPCGWWENGEGWADSERADHLVDLLSASTADVLVLQELYLEDVRARLRASMSTAGYAFTTPALGNDWLNEDSGLFVASRLPVRNWSFEEFDAKSGEDALSDKGIVRIDVDVSGRLDADTLSLFGAHLQSGINGHGVRKKQLQQLQRALSRVPDAHLRAAIGDFNVHGETKNGDDWHPNWEWQRMMNLLEGATDASLRPGQPEFTWDGVLNQWMTRPNDVSQKRLDYVLTFGPLRAQAQNNPFLHQGRHLSDHFGITAQLSSE